MKNTECGCNSCGNKTKLSAVAFGIALGLIYGLSLLIFAWVVYFGGYSDATVAHWGEYLKGYSASVPGGFIGLGWGFLKGFITGVIFAWFYNLALCCCKCCCKCFCKRKAEPEVIEKK